MQQEKQFLSSRRGFTLIELLVVVLIVAILAANAGVAHAIFLKTLSRQCWVEGTSNNAHALCQDVTKKQTGNVSGTWTQYSY